MSFRREWIIIIGKKDLWNWFYDATVSYFDSVTYLSQKNQPWQVKPKGFITKKTDSTFFPDNWSQEKIRDEVASAYAVKIYKWPSRDGWKIYEGISTSWQRYEIITDINDNVTTAYGKF